jgi:hypothetical protein
MLQKTSKTYTKTQPIHDEKHPKNINLAKKETKQPAKNANRNMKPPTNLKNQHQTHDKKLDRTIQFLARLGQKLDRSIQFLATLP